jgi:hypothetical protein
MAVRIDNYFNLGTSYRGRIYVEDQATNVGANQSTVRYRISVIKDSGSGFWNSNGGTRSWSITGVQSTSDASGSSSYDYRTTSGVPVGGEVVLADYTRTITHNTNGSYVDAFTASISHADNPPGSGSNSPTVTLTDFPEPASGSFAATNIQYDSATISASVTTNGNGTSSTMRFYWRQSGVGGYTDAGTGTSKNLTGLLPSTAYQWYVVTTNNTGNSSSSAVQSFTTAVNPSNFLVILEA